MRTSFSLVEQNVADFSHMLAIDELLAIDSWQIYIWSTPLWIIFTPKIHPILDVYCPGLLNLPVPLH